MAEPQEGTSFVYDMLLASLLREFYIGSTLYLGTDGELKELQKHFDKDSAEAYTKRCNTIITHTTLCNALNTAFNQHDAQQLKLADSVEKAKQITRFGQLFCTDEERQLMQAWKNNPINLKKKNQLEKNGSLSKSRRTVETVQTVEVVENGKTFRRRKPIQVDMTVYSMVQGDYRYEYRLPDEGKNIVYVESLADPTQNLTHAVNWKFGADVRHVTDMVNMLPELQARCDEVEARGSAAAERLDFGVLMGFRLEKLTVDEIFPGTELPAELTDDRFYRIVAASRQKNLFMVLSAYLPYLTTGQKKDIEKTLSGSQQDWFQETTDADENMQSDPGTLAVLDRAIQAVLETRDHYNDLAGVPESEDDRAVAPMAEDAPDFWYEFHYIKWIWTKGKDGRFSLAPVDITDDDGKPKVFQMLPYQIISSEGKIYLVGLRLDMPDSRNKVSEDEWMLSNLRVDRIRGLHRVTAETGHPLHKDKDIYKLADYYDDIQCTVATNMDYRNNSPKMFSGTPEPWQLDCSPAITNVLVDTFGANALTFCEQVQGPLPLDRSPDYDEDDGAPRPVWNRVQVEACWDGIRLFLLQNLDNVKLADTPKQATARRKLCQQLLNAMDNYDKY